MKYQFKTKGTCAQVIDFEINNDVVTNVVFTGGCNGNLKAISKLVDGMTVDEIEDKLKGNICGFKSTSCADQLAIAVREAYSSQS
ncbi:MAG: TIGR03905 family TSCPD domain-containing protein [Lachnospiraceae bacterium]|nr:TIGR03905 family TSCPD domain-containing protein [Lachnospiraceae bacterium]